ncbi:SP0191 family lipoprotein [Streptococcus panodentis]|uniref:SP-0191-like C-terminal domain-containing protein n=1 Tax=Streptococcus panodentis TaxID=1581472 RepID=A0ABS5B078_9STRE|nr:SP0191 family lipoprotein [Streptococcus panodentis]MBP2622228.1 hypothetical protein [Streptococcus panodentis]
MKKIMTLFTLALLFLTGCTFTNKNSTASDTESPSSSKKASSSSSSSSSESTEVVSKTLVGYIQGVHHRDTITYQGEKILNLRLELLADLPEDMAAASADRTPEELTAIIQEGLKSNPQVAELQAIEGFKLEYSVSADRKFQTNIEMDFQKLNDEQLDKIASDKELGLNDFKGLTSERFILGMKLNGLKEE